MSLPPFKSFGTLAVHAGQDPDPVTGAVVPAISLSTTFKQSSPGVHTGYEYSRSGNPTRDAYEKCVAALENGKYAMAFASGLAASTTICHLLQSGDHIVSMNDVYGGTNRLFNRIVNHMGLTTTFVDATDLEAFKAAIQPNTRLVWLETPTNPTLRIVDIKACAEIIRNHENKNIILCVDNTFMSSYFQRPLELGADISMHSVTKYMNGHSDSVQGIAITNRDDLHQRLRFLQNGMGAIPGPFDAYLANRGLKTLHIRMRQHASNAMTIARYLEKSPQVQNVIYPGLESHPQHEVAKRQMTGFGGMISFNIKGDLSSAKKFLESVKLFTLAESLGAVESLCELPAVMTHAGIPPAERAKLGVLDTLVRLSVGIEEVEDLIEDIQQALDIAVPL
eukprot:Colp12_sorted_trinity150504_noHs@25171